MGLGFPMGQSRWLDIQMGEKVSEQRERGTISFTGSESSRRGDPQRFAGRFLVAPSKNLPKTALHTCRLMHRHFPHHDTSSASFHIYLWLHRVRFQSNATAGVLRVQFPRQTPKG